MGLFDGEAKSYVVGGIAALAAAALARELGSGFHDLGRPMAKAAIKTGISLMDKGREWFAHVGEVVEDLVIEARLELDEQHNALATPTPAVNSKQPQEVH